MPGCQSLQEGEWEQGQGPRPACAEQANVCHYSVARYVGRICCPRPSVHVISLAVVRDATSRLANGEGTRLDVSVLMYILVNKFS